MDMRTKKKPIAHTDESSCKQADSTGFYSRVLCSHYISFGNTIKDNEEILTMKNKQIRVAGISLLAGLIFGNVLPIEVKVLGGATVALILLRDYDNFSYSKLLKKVGGR
jgi:hypothetical protein